MTHTPEPWEPLENLPPNEEIPPHKERPTECCGTVLLGPHDYNRAVACVNALAGIPDPAAELARLRQIEKQWIEDTRAHMENAKAAEQAIGKPYAWLVWCPSDHEDDYQIFTIKSEAAEADDLFRVESESDEEDAKSRGTTGVVPLYADIPAIREELARLREVERAATVAIKPVLEAVANSNGSDFMDSSWNPDAHVEVTLTISECRALRAALDAAEGGAA